MSMLDYPFDGALVLQKKRALKKELLCAEGLIDKKVAIMSGCTVGEFKNMLELFLLKGGIRPQFHEGGYALFYENVVFDDGTLAGFAPDVLYIHTSVRNVRAWPAPGMDTAEADELLNTELARFTAVWDAAEKLGCPVVQNNFELPLWRNYGNMDSWDKSGRVNFINRLNARFAEEAQKRGYLFIHDINYLSAMHGVDEWCDTAAWYGYKYPCAPQFIPEFCHSLAGLVKSLFGRTKKAVVTDLDNTLWGGVIGEEGAEGVELGSESPAGMAFAEFQEYLAMLAARGILLNVASKNEKEPAESGFKRDDSPLKTEDFLCFEANWNPKSQSIAKIAETLNIGIDSLVFTDDNPAEREEVRRVHPAVEAPPIAQPEASIKMVDRGAYFEVSSLSKDDVARGEMYKQNAQRAAQQQSFADYGEYLKSLEMSAEIAPFKEEWQERITQLINKTNQFNLTTRRYTAAEVSELAKDGTQLTLSGRLVDKFGDNGLTTAIIAKQTGDALDIELWIMSCRVFKRGLEHAMFDALVAEAKKRGVKTITGTWLPTAKNVITKDFYTSIGFQLTEENEDGRRFSYTVPKSYENQNKAIEIL